MTESNQLTLFSENQFANLSKTAWTPKGDLSQRDWQEFGEALGKLKSSSQWWIGDWWAYGEHRYGDRKAIVESDDWEGARYETCKNYASVCRVFETSLRNDLLSFSHHSIVVSLPEDWRTKLLDWACEPLKEGKSKPHSVRALEQKVKEAQQFINAGWTQSQLERKEALDTGATVLVNKSKGDDGKLIDGALIAYADAKGLLVPIDRTSDWGNPFVMDADGDRDTVCDNFAFYLERKPSLQKRIVKDLKGKALQCWCYPERCHGETLIKSLEELVNGTAKS